MSFEKPKLFVSPGLFLKNLFTTLDTSSVILSDFGNEIFGISKCEGSFFYFPDQTPFPPVGVPFFSIRMLSFFLVCL